MNRKWSSYIVISCLFIAGTDSARSTAAEPAATPTYVVTSATAPDAIQIAARQLAAGLRQLHPNMPLKCVHDVRSDCRNILVGTPDQLPPLRPLSTAAELAQPESYWATTVANGTGRVGVIAGHDTGGVVAGVYAVLRRLGFGHYLSFDTIPPPKDTPFSCQDWDFSGRPLVPVRLVFDWHNFLSGCSTWDLPQWRQWIIQSQKMGYNAVMVHAYGNNPMAGFMFNGLQKPVGYLSSTQVGRDWSTNHVNDVRRLWGGELFRDPVFGSSAAITGSDAARTAAAQKLMSAAFATAEQRGVNVYFAVDVDTTSANPQTLIETLPTDSRFTIKVPSMAWMGQDAGKAWLVNPDTKAGYSYYRAQVAELLRVYPQIDCLVVWHRAGNTPWMGFAPSEMPPTWQEEYATELRRTPQAEKMWHAVHMFAQAKIVRAFQRAVHELQRDDVTVAFGSWRIDFLPAADRFLPADVPLIPLDWMVLRDQSVFDTAQRRSLVADVASHRPVIPIAWAHHDDGNYVGRPYTPYSDFYDRLEEMHCARTGFGIIHWMTKPLDLYFKSLVDQVWSASKNVPLAQTCQRMAVDLVGQQAAGPMAAYLEDWVTNMPKIGRETSDLFIDHELDPSEQILDGHRRRVQLLEAARRLPVSSQGRHWIDYFSGLEQFVLDVHRTEHNFLEAKAQLASGDLSAARAAMRRCHAEQVVAQFAQHSQNGGLTRGEQGLIVSMNTRWLPHYERYRQALRLAPIRYNFAPTSHDPLAQSAGIFTFHVSPDHAFWQCLGTEETGADVFRIPADAKITAAADATSTDVEVARTGIESATPLQITCRPILTRGSRRQLNALPLAPGAYRLSLLMIVPEADLHSPHVADLKVTANRAPTRRGYRFPKTHASFLKLQCRGSGENAWNSICELRCAALDPKGAVKASGAQRGYEPGLAIDGQLKTRWAVEGRDHWIQFALQPETHFDHIDIDWYEGTARQYDADLLMSDDGHQWRPLVIMDEPSSVLVSDRIDLAKRAAAARRIVRLSYPLTLETATALNVELKPIAGTVVVSGLVVEVRGER